MAYGWIKNIVIAPTIARFWFENLFINIPIRNIEKAYKNEDKEKIYKKLLSKIFKIIELIYVVKNP